MACDCIIGGIIAVTVWTAAVLLVRWLVAIVDNGRAGSQ